MKLNYFSFLILIVLVFVSFSGIVAAVDSNLNGNVTSIEEDSSELISFIDESSKESILSQPVIEDNCEYENDDLMSEGNSMKYIHVSPDGIGDGSEGNPTSLKNAITNIQDNSIVCMADGNYTFESILTITAKENITILSNNLGKVIISGGGSTTAYNYVFSLEGVNNFTLKGIVFKDITFRSNLIISSSKKVSNVNYDSKNLNIENCSFINCNKNGKQLINIVACDIVSVKNCYFMNNTVQTIIAPSISEVLDKTVTPNKLIKESQFNIQNCIFENNTCEKYIINIASLLGRSGITISECNFINNSFKGADIYIETGRSSFGKKNSGPIQYSNPDVATIVDCNFSSNGNLPAVEVNNFNSKGIIFEDNFVKSNYAIYFKNYKPAGSAMNSEYTNIMNKAFYLGELNSITNIVVLNGDVVNVTAGDKITLSATLVDNMGNAINIPNLRLVINGTECPTQFIDGVYYADYDVPLTYGLLSIDVNYTTFETVSGGFNYITHQMQDDFEFSILNSRMCEVTGAGLFVKPALNMSMDNISNNSYGEDITISVNITNLESGSLVYEFIKGNEVVKTFTDSFTNNVSTITVNDLPAGDYKVTAKYLEDDNFGTTTVSKEFTVNKANSTVQIIIDQTIPVGDNITVQAVLPANATGNVTYRLKGENKTVNVTETAVFAGLSEGNYTIYAVYNGDENYNPSEEYNATFRVVKVNPKLVIEYSAPVINENVTVTVTMDKDINGDVNVTINKLDPVVRQVVNGTLTFNITNVPYGPQNITVSFRGNDKYNEMENSTSFFVNKLDVNLAIAADTVTYGEPLVVNVTANEKFSGDVIVKIGNLTEIAHVVDGKGNATFNNLTANSYIITASCPEDETFNADTKNITATVKGVEVPADKALNTNVPANSKSPTFSIKLDKDATGNFTVSVDNGKIVKTVALKDGAASITVDNLAVGSHQVTVSYSGDGKYAPITQNTTVTIKEPAKPKVTKKATKIVAKKKTFKAKKKVKKYTITLKSGKTLVKKVKVTLKVKGKTYKATTNKKGKATFKIKNLKKKGKYTATIKFAGNKNYKPTTKKVKLTVKK
ncbi:Ig-like domain repeat protein [Methanobrevibacter sp.]|uniref:Ig-like domain repeat protein n=1 Tax=Methanobrevibacter sp. TaxID=66852 RepID=UPI003869FA2A